MTPIPSDNQPQSETGMDQPRNRNKMIYPLGVVCAALFVADVLVHRHAHFDFELWLGFYGFFGFISCVALVWAARILRFILKRNEDYYDQ